MMFGSAEAAQTPAEILAETGESEIAQLHPVQSR